MKAFFLTFSLFFSTLAVPCGAELIILTNAGTSTGDNLDDLVPGDLDATVNVVEIPGLTITVTAIAGSNNPKLNALSTSFGIDEIDAADDSDTFESAYNESFTFHFNKAVSISVIDFVSFTTGEAFSFGGTTINFADTSGSLYTPGSPLEFAANAPITVTATAGAIGIESMTLTATNVPEPSTLALSAFAGLILLAYRRKN